MRTPRARKIAVLALSLVAAALVLPSASRAEIIVKLEITAAKALIHLEPDSRSPVVEILDRGAIVKLSSAQKFRTSWFYVQFVSSRTGRMLAGYVTDDVVRKLTSTLKIIDLTPAAAEIASPKEFDMTKASFPLVAWGNSENAIMRAEGRPLDRELSGDMEFLLYHREVLGKRCLVIYVLVDRRLSSIRLRLLERYADKDRYIADYNKIREFLNAKVGQPRFNNVVWKDIAYAERGVSLGTAVTTGNLSLSSEWVYGDTGLRLSLTGENSEVLFAAEINALKAKNPASF